MIYFDNIIFSLQKNGGISVVWYNILKEILSGNIPFCCLEYPDAKENFLRNNLDIPMSNIVHYKIPCKLNRYLPFCAEELQIPIFHSSYYRYCTNRETINITTIHDFTYEYYFSGLAKTIHCHQKYKAIRHSKVVICISENTKRDLLHFVPDISPSKIQVIYNGVSEDYYQLNVSDRLDLSNYILFVGARDGYKNFRFVVDALENTSYNLAICGKPLSLTEKDLLNSKLGPHRYSVYENVDNQTLNKIYNSVYCLVYPSSYEGFGIPVIEAQRSGCPVIALNTSSIPEIIGETPLLLPNLDAAHFLDRMRLIADDRIRNEIIEAGLVNSRRFSWNKMTYEYHTIYQELLNM